MHHDIAYTTVYISMCGHGIFSPILGYGIFSWSCLSRLIFCPSFTLDTAVHRLHIDFLIFVFLPRRAPLALSGLSELPLEQRLLVLLANEWFPLFSLSLLEEPFSIFFFFLWAFFICTSMLSSIYRIHSTQQGAFSPAQRMKPSTCRSERDNASKQTELAKASMSSSIYQLAAFSKRTKNSKLARPSQIY